MTKKSKRPKVLTLWRAVEGDVIETQAFEDGDEIILGHPDDDDLRRYDPGEDGYIHVDDLYEGNGIFDNEEAAKKYAIEWMNKKIFEYQLKLSRLHGTNTVKA